MSKASPYGYGVPTLGEVLPPTEAEPTDKLFPVDVRALELLKNQFAAATPRVQEAFIKHLAAQAIAEHRGFVPRVVKT